MRNAINFTVNGKEFNGCVYKNPFMFGRIERVINCCRLIIREIENEKIFH